MRINKQKQIKVFNVKYKIFEYFFFSLFLAALGLHCYTGFSLVAASGELLCSCGAWTSHCGGFSYRGAQAIGTQVSAVEEEGSEVASLELESVRSPFVMHELSWSN